MLKIGFGRISRGTFFRVLCTLLLAATVGFAGPVKPGGQREVKTYTANLYIGADLMGVLTVDPDDLSGDHPNRDGNLRENC